jgi:hypothetical protein
LCFAYRVLAILFSCPLSKSVRCHDLRPRRYAFAAVGGDGRLAKSSQMSAITARPPAQ